LRRRNGTYASKSNGDLNDQKKSTENRSEAYKRIWHCQFLTSKKNHEIKTMVRSDIKMPYLALSPTRRAESAKKKRDIKHGGAFGALAMARKHHPQ